jgi:hypothetical protein
MARTFANPERPFQVTDQASLAQLGNDVLMGELGIAPIGMIAYHGTPHLIKDKFDISKVGTGEGAQAYGHGMYFAEHPVTAQTYAVKGANQGAMPTPPTPSDFLIDNSRFYKQDDQLFKQVGDKLDAISVTKDEYGQALRTAQAYFQQRNQAGNLYKVDIPDEYIPKMLDWDKPLSQQPKSVQDTLAKIDPDSYSPKGMDYDPSELGQTIYHRLAQKSDEPLRQEWVKKRDMLLEKGLTNNPELEAHLMTNPNPYQVGSQVLNEYGIKGIRYLDAGSREAGGTSNFVVFDPTDVKMLERNNQPVQGLLDPKMTLDEFTQMSNKGQMRQARTVDQDLEDILAKKMPATKFDIGSSSKYGFDYETGDFTKKLKDAGLTVYDDKMGTVIAGQSKEAVEKLKNASTPIEYGQSFGYEPEDILKFYIQRRGGNPELGYSDFINDMNLINQSEGLLGK